ncbi:hypothetical protein HanHA300_Chr11g0419891 [Helianthus annuus]|nr:hypothetical protein HanHA300_Chr11g0419891 [Helianthus annuus]KAJ0519018.1 hypothetical protein HanHA89_Chr11g0443901 [Helianthus annuus]KAJ0687018.1 hypothetical protein HanLR1_Chr11g0421191 [Helianthus annuus]KAJ0690822.1 hypothetical protein HanOQP8_Chr11g0422071 [Helianthus annuus]
MLETLAWLSPQHDSEPNVNKSTPYNSSGRKMGGLGHWLDGYIFHTKWLPVGMSVVLVPVPKNVRYCTDTGPVWFWYLKAKFGIFPVPN